MNNIKSPYICALLLSAVLCGCGGPKYSKDFKEFLGLKLAEAAPIKLNSVAIEELTGGKIESVFTFSGDYVVTDNLYSKGEVIALVEIESFVKKMEPAGIPDNVLIESKVPQLIASLAEINKVPVLKVATAKGTKSRVSGKAKAQLDNHGIWGFQILDVTGATLAGEKVPDGQWVAEGSPAENAQKARSDAVFSELNALGNRLIKENEEKKKAEAARAEEAAKKAAEEAALAGKLRVDETKRRDEEAKSRADQARISADIAAEATRISTAKSAAEADAREAAFLAAIEKGKIYFGVWQGASARGEIGIKFGERVNMGRDFSIDGVLFDPAKPQNEKPFSALTSGLGTPDKPYIIEIKTVVGEGVPVADKFGPDIKNKTIGLLHSETRFVIPLTFDGADTSLSGELENSFMFSYQIDGPAKVRFLKDYAPKGRRANNSGAMPPSANPDDKAHAAQPQSDSNAFPSQSQNQKRTRKLSQDETNTLVLESSTSSAAFWEAMHVFNAPAARKILAQMKNDYPDSPLTIRAEMYMAAMEKNKKRLTTAYKLYKTKYSMSHAEELLLDSMYAKCLNVSSTITKIPGF